MKTLWLMGAAVITACAARETLPLTTTSASVNKVPSEHAIRELTSERCHRQLSCDNIGNGKRWGSLDACMTEMRRVTRDRIAGATCPAVDSAQLSTCLEETRNQGCEELGATLDSCTTARMCR